MERELLHARTVDAPRVPVDYGTPESLAYFAMNSVGRMRVSHTDPSDGCRVNHITDLGRLALRVCPVDES